MFIRARHQRVGGAAFDDDERGEQGAGGGGRGAAAVGAAWLAFVVAPAAVGDPAGAALMAGASPYFAGPAVQSGWAAGAVACALLLAARRRSFDHLETP
ncbi:hypothetical protein [Streptomyces cyaneofuscatus]|uniref:hypothetical protein n=1 Tax=Streptomyces cyaneofuscatus TaxID=66883 RepID=UPI0036AF1FCD